MRLSLFEIMITRRNFLRNSSLAAAATSAIAFPHVGHSAEVRFAKRGQRPRKIIMLVADGMSMGTLTCGDHLSRLLRGRGLTWMQLCGQPSVHTGWMNMRSLNSLVTDSSAASSSWGSGSRIINGVVNQLGNGTNLKTLYELFAQAGWKRGLVTTTEITHATPAGFATNVESREHANNIAVQYLERRVDLLLGGGSKFFDPKERKDKRDLLMDFQHAGYAVMKTLPELNAASMDQRWLGVFDKSHMPFTVDHKHDAKKLASVPTLPAMTSVALKWLAKEPHFILQVEGGRVDHGCHNCDAAGALYDLIAFDEALDACLEFQRRAPDTLLVMTTDHGNANLGLNGMGSGYGQSSWLFHNLLKVKKSFPEMLTLMRKSEKAKPDEYEAKLAKAIAANPHAHPADKEVVPDSIKDPEKDQKEDEEKKDKAKETEIMIVKSTKEIMDVIRENTGYKISEKRAEMLAPFLAKKGDALYEVMKSDVCGFGQAMANHLGISFTGNAHTADYVPVVAKGPGAERFAGFIQNTDVFYHFLALARIDYRNPIEPLIDEPTLHQAQHVERVEEYKLA
jgi:alkaline phosphatase